MNDKKGYTRVNTIIPNELYLKVQLVKEMEMRTIKSLVSFAIKEYVEKVLKNQNGEVKLQDSITSE